MIQLFKKIRKKLIAEKRLVNYLAYAIGEILLVVIGILLALQFNNKNQEQENTKKERGYLISIVEDIEYQKVILKDMKRHSLESIEVAKSIIKDFDDNKSFIGIDSLNDKLNYLIETYNFPNTNNTYSELVASGQLNLIKNKTLSIDIINYYLNSQERADDKALSIDIINYYLNSQESADDVKNNIENIFYPEVYPTIKKLCQITMYDEDVGEDEDFLLGEYKELETLINQRLQKPEIKLDLLNAIKIRIQILSVHTFMINDILEIAKELIESIDNYLGLTPDMVNHYD